MTKKKHYDLSPILAKKAHYYLLYGERSNGKSYAVKRRFIEGAYKNDNEKFVYMRRWREDIMYNRAEKYWDDMETDDEGNHRIEEITNGEYTCIALFRGDYYLANRDENGKKIRGKKVGSVVVLSGDTHEKSNVFVGYYRIVFEEMITKNGYLGDEVSTFMSMVSTILRRREGEIFLIGNTLTKACPYFREWELFHVPKQPIGTIDMYHYRTGDIDRETGEEIVIDIAVEYCDNTSGTSRMIIGRSAKMINGGEWESDAKEHLPLPYGEYRKHFTILIDDEIELFALDLLSMNRTPVLYVREIHRKWTDREKYDIVITDRYNSSYSYMKVLDPTLKITKLIKRLFETGNVCYEDNLIGTTFTTLLKNRKIF